MRQLPRRLLFQRMCCNDVVRFRIYGIHSTLSYVQNNGAISFRNVPCNNIHVISQRCHCISVLAGQLHWYKIYCTAISSNTEPLVVPVQSRA